MQKVIDGQIVKQKNQFFEFQKLLTKREKKGMFIPQVVIIV